MLRLKSVKFCSHTGPRSARTWVLQMFRLKSVEFCWILGSRSAGTWVLQTFRLKSVKFCWILGPKSAGTWGFGKCAVGAVPVCFRWFPEFSNASCKRTSAQVKFSASCPWQWFRHNCWSFLRSRVLRALAAASRALLAAASSSFGSETKVASFPSQGKRPRPATWGLHGPDPRPTGFQSTAHRAPSHGVDLLLRISPRYTHGTIWEDFNYIQYRNP